MAQTALTIQNKLRAASYIGAGIVAGRGLLINPRIGLIGPSTVQNNQYGSNSSSSIRSGNAASGPHTWAMMEHRRGTMLLAGISAAPYWAGDNRGEGSAGFAEYPTQISGLTTRLTSTGADPQNTVIIYDPGRNDIQAGMTVAQFKADCLRDIADIRARAIAKYIFLSKLWKKPVAYGGLWASGGAARAAVDEINTWMATLVASDLKLIDFPAFVTNPANADGDPYPNVCRSDFTHLTNYGGRLAGKAENAALAPYISVRSYPALPVENVVPAFAGTGGVKSGAGVTGNVVDGWTVTAAAATVACSQETIDGKVYQVLSASQTTGIAATGTDIDFTRTVAIPANKKTGLRMKVKIPASVVPYMLFFRLGDGTEQGANNNMRAACIAGVADATAQTAIGGAGANFQTTAKFDGSEALDLWLETSSYVETGGSATNIAVAMRIIIGAGAQSSDVFAIKIGEIQTFDWPI